jgi:hypothetical protein
MLPALTAALLLVTAGAPTAAQDTFDESGDSEFEVLGAIALLTPIGNLTADPATFGTTINVNVAYGLDGIFWASNNWGFGATGWYSPAQLQARDLPQGSELPDLGKADYLVGAAQAIYRIRSEGSRSPLEPYFAAGLGVRHISVDEMANPEVESGTDPAGTIAGGVRLQGVMSTMMIRLELRDNISTYKSPTTGESRLQNDILISFGVGVRF